LGISECPSEILDRLVIFENLSKFNKDSRMIKIGVENILDDLSKKNKLELTPEQRHDVVFASFISDIGKSSPLDDPMCQLAAIKLFSSSAGKLEDPTEVTVEETLRTYLPKDAEVIISNLLKVGIIGDMTMRNFFDMHAFWTKSILDEHSQVFSKRVVEIASSHHLVQGINPCGIKEAEIPDNLKYCIYLLMALDKYQAKTERGKATHPEAMRYLRGVFIEKYGDSPIMNSIIESIDELGKAGTLFSKTQK
jgi:hypothetical protein